MSIPMMAKKDNFELIRDKVALLLVNESARQQGLAEDEDEDPTPYKLRVFIERTNPFDSYLTSSADMGPVVNVWYDGSEFDKSKSNVSDRQFVTSMITVDCFAYAQSASTTLGHTSGDEFAAREAQAAARMVRNILMHDDNKYLGFGRGIVSRRWVRSVDAFLIPNGSPGVQRVRGVRISLEVDHLETTDLMDENMIEFINLQIRHASDGEIIAEMDFDYTPEPE